MWKTKIAGLLVVIAALLAVDVLIRAGALAQARASQLVIPERLVAVARGDTGCFIIRMNEHGQIDVCKWFSTIPPPRMSPKWERLP